MIAALHLKDKSGEPLPWVSLLLADLVSLRAFCKLPLAPPDSSDHFSQEWVRLIVNQPTQWKDMIESITFFSSIADRSKNSLDTHVVGGVGCDVASPTHICSVCHMFFSTNKALSGHMRMVHKVRSVIRLFVSSSSCPACLTAFSCRLSCISHLSDSRRPKCRDSLLSGDFPRILQKIAQYSTILIAYKSERQSVMGIPMCCPQRLPCVRMAACAASALAEAIAFFPLFALISVHVSPLYFVALSETDVDFDVLRCLRCSVKRSGLRNAFLALFCIRMNTLVTIPCNLP